MAMDAASSTGEKLVPPLLMTREHDAEPMPPLVLAGHANVDSPAIGSCETR